MRHFFRKPFNLTLQYLLISPNIQNLSSQHSPTPAVFNTKVKNIQRNRTANEIYENKFDYLKDEVAYQLADRLLDIKRFFKVALDYGCGKGHLLEHIEFANQEEILEMDTEAAGKSQTEPISSSRVKFLYQCDTALELLKVAKTKSEHTFRVHQCDEFLPFRTNHFDLIISNLYLHWVNDLRTCLAEIHRALRPDGCFIGTIWGPDTLYQLRSSLQMASQERLGGIGMHVSPFTSIRDLGSLLSEAKFKLITIDTDDIIVHYPTMFELVEDLRGMGENNASLIRNTALDRDVLIGASSIYQNLYGTQNDDQSNFGEQSKELDLESRGPSIPATFQIIYFIGWKEHDNQPKPLKPGTANFSFKDLSK